MNLNRHVPADVKVGADRAEEMEEARYFHEVCVAMRSYEKYAGQEIDRLARSFNALSAEDRKLIGDDLDVRIKRMREGVKINQSFLNILVAQAEDMKGEGANVCPKMGVLSAEATCDCSTSLMNVSKVRSTLKQFAREWSSFRQEERESAYRPLLDGLQKHVPMNRPDGGKSWVLCPGSGLGRLPYEVMKLGYNAQGNEFSYFMLMGSYFMLNHDLQTEAICIQPYVLNTTNRFDHNDNLKVVAIPDLDTLDGIVSENGLKPPGDFSMCAGDFGAIYGGDDQKGLWDAVLTCFFMDTGRNIIDYVKTLAHIIPAEGRWLNLGPLLYHYAQDEDGISVELGYDDVKRVLSKWFTIEEEKQVDCLYTSNPNSMMQVVYHCVYFVATRNTVDVVLTPTAPFASSSYGFGPTED